jgi:hypothetical protein
VLTAALLLLLLLPLLLLLLLLLLPPLLLPPLLLPPLLQIKGFAKSLRGGGDQDAPGFWMKLLGPRGPPPVRQPVSIVAQGLGF